MEQRKSLGMQPSRRRQRIVDGAWHNRQRSCRSYKSRQKKQTIANKNEPWACCVQELNH